MNNIQLYSDYLYNTLPSFPTAPIVAHGQEALNAMYAVADLSARNIKCLTNDKIFITGDNLNECLKNSKNIYNACRYLPNSNECQVAEQTYTNFLERMSFWNTNRWYQLTCGAQPMSQWTDCKQKHTNWRSACSESNLHKDGCIKAEEILKEGLKNGFEEASWRGYNWGGANGDKDGLSKSDCQKTVMSITGSMTSTPIEIKRAYKQKAIKAHPDKGGSTEQMQKLNDANDKVAQCFKNKILGS